MAHTKDFDRKLHDLFDRKTARLRSLVRRKPGAVKTLGKARRDRRIRELQAIATIVLLNQGGKGVLRRITTYERRRQIKGRGIEQRYRRMIDWAGGLGRGPIIYSFWRGKKCLYVGKGTSWRRLKTYRKSYYLKEATTLKVRGVSGKSNLAKAECLSAHLYAPADNLARIARGKWSKSCPICHTNRKIRKELLALFRC